MTCKQCGGELTPYLKYNYEQLTVKDGRGFVYTVPHAVTPTMVGYGYEGRGHFCSIFCGYEFGLRAAQETQQ